MVQETVNKLKKRLSNVKKIQKKEAESSDDEDLPLKTIALSQKSHITTAEGKREADTGARGLKTGANEQTVSADNTAEKAKTVNQSEQKGRQMERDDKEYICPICSGMITVGERVKPDPEKKEKMAAVRDTPKKSTEGCDEKKHIKKLGKGKEKWLVQRCIVGDCKRDARLGAEEADDIVLSSSEIKRLALAIEEELYKLFDNTGHKYRAKFRSLLFNIKDQKNKGLFRKILARKIKPSKLVKMSTEELASRELAKWRQMETKHTLAMIEQTEKEAMKEGHQHIRKKTHKGEVEVDDEDMSTLVVAHKVVEEKKKKAQTKAKEKKVEVQAEEVVRSALKQVRSQSAEARRRARSRPRAPLYSSYWQLSKHGHADPRSRQDMAAQTVSIWFVSVIGKATKKSLRKLDANSDSALQSGLEAKPKFTPSGPMIWKGFISMQDFAKLFTSAYRVSGPVERLGLPDTLQICGRIGPDQMWDYLGKIRQAGSRDVCIVRFIPGSDDEKVAYVHLYSYLNSRGRCGVVGNAPKHVKDLYIVPLASHSKIPQVLLPFDGPGLENNRPHMLIGIIVRQKVKRPSELEPTGKSSQSSSITASHPKKVRVSTDQETEAYSPTADSDDLARNAEPYSPSKEVEEDAPYDPEDDSQFGGRMLVWIEGKGLAVMEGSTLALKNTGLVARIMTIVIMLMVVIVSHTTITIIGVTILLSSLTVTDKDMIQTIDDREAITHSRTETDAS
nr:hypothetical protein BaRGS_027071 [Batillaria attramentaria]